MKVLHPYIIVTPPYVHNSSGVRAIFRLCHEMNERGIEAYVTSSVINPKWNTPVARRKNVNDCIVVYPEIYKGNPLGARNVVRYILQNPDLLGGDTTFPKDDFILYYSRMFSDTGPFLTTPVYERDLFKPFPKYRRSGKFFYIGKAAHPPSEDQIEGMTQITGDWPAKREDLAELLKRAEAFYTWDAMTGLTVESTLCGCPCVIMDEGHFTKAQIEKTEVGTAGLAWGEEDLDRARKTLHEVQANVDKMEARFEQDLFAFIQQTQKRFVPSPVKFIFRDKLRVSCYMDNGDNGSNYYRTVLPFRAINEHDKDISTAIIKNGDPEDRIRNGFDCDVVFLPRVASSRTLETFQGTSASPIVCDYDDNLFAVSPLSPHYKGLGTENIQYRTSTGEVLPIWEDGRNIDLKKNRQMLAQIAACIQNAKAVTVTTDLLADAYRPINPNIKVLPNFIDMRIWKRLPLDNNGTIRLFWAGGISHYEDWTILKDVLPKVMERYPQTHLVLMGAKWDATLKGIPEERIEFHEWVHSEAYPYKVRILNPDICLIPLRDTIFAMGKSPIKFVEMSALEVPCVMSHVSPYKEHMTEENGVYIAENDPDGWEEGVSLLIEKKTLRSEMGKAAHDYVAERFDVNVQYKQYVDFFKEIAA